VYNSMRPPPRNVRATAVDDLYIYIYIQINMSFYPNGSYRFFLIFLFALLSASNYSSMPTTPDDGSGHVITTFAKVSSRRLMFACSTFLITALPPPTPPPQVYFPAALVCTYCNIIYISYGGRNIL